MVPNLVVIYHQKGHEGLWDNKDGGKEEEKNVNITET